MTWRQRWCGLRHGHDRVLAFVPSAIEGQPSTVLMRCTSCQHDTPGWVPASTPPVLRYDGDPRRHALVACRLVRKSA